MTEPTSSIIKPDPNSTDLFPEHIRAAINAGHVGEVVIFCDNMCGREFSADFTGETQEIRFAAARKHLADTQGWKITDGQDLCPVCSMPQQPDGISEQSRDLPDPRVAAERVDAYLAVCGDGLYDVQDGQPLYARDLQALVNLARKAQDAWIVPKIDHDENRMVTPHVRDGRVYRAAGESDPEHARLYAAQMLAAADKAEERRA